MAFFVPIACGKRTENFCAIPFSSDGCKTWFYSAGTAYDTEAGYKPKTARSLSSQLSVTRRNPFKVSCGSVIALLTGVYFEVTQTKCDRFAPSETVAHFRERYFQLLLILSCKSCARLTSLSTYRFAQSWRSSSFLSVRTTCCNKGSRTSMSLQALRVLSLSRHLGNHNLNKPCLNYKVVITMALWKLPIRASIVVVVPNDCGSSNALCINLFVFVHAAINS